MRIFMVDDKDDIGGLQTRSEKVAEAVIRLSGKPKEKESKEKKSKEK